MKTLVLIIAVILPFYREVDAIKFTPLTVASEGQFPFSTELKYKGISCTAAIVHPTWVITAAHCLTLLCNIEDIKNESQPITNCSTAGLVVIDGDGQHHQALRIAVDPDYTFPYPAHDIAAVKIANEFKMGARVRSIAISPATETQTPAQDCLLIGHGHANHRNETTEQGPNHVYWLKGGTMAPCSQLQRKVQMEDKAVAKEDTVFTSLVDTEVSCVSDVHTEDMCLGDNAAVLVCDKMLSALTSTMLDYRTDRVDESGVHCDSESSFVVMVPMSAGGRLWLRRLIPDMQEAVVDEDYVQLPAEKGAQPRPIRAGGQESEVVGPWSDDVEGHQRRRSLTRRDREAAAGAEPAKDETGGTPPAGEPSGDKAAATENKTAGGGNGNEGGAGGGGAAPATKAPIVTPKTVKQKEDPVPEVTAGPAVDANTTQMTTNTTKGGERPASGTHLLIAAFGATTWSLSWL